MDKEKQQMGEERHAKDMEGVKFKLVLLREQYLTV